MIEAVHVIVRGRVQGVGFRAFTVAVAGHCGVTGWVKNSPDGQTVEIVASGDAGALDQFLKLIRQGPPASRVDQIERCPINVGEDFADFRVRH